MINFDENIFSEENIKMLILLYQGLHEKFITIHYGDMPLVVNSQVAKHFGLKDNQQIDTVCFGGIITYMQRMIAQQKIDRLTPQDFEEED